MEQGLFVELHLQEKIKRYAVPLSLALIIILTFLVYANSLNGKFIWDDNFLVKDNLYIRSWSNLPKIFVRDWGQGAGVQYSFYRPLCIVTYMIDYSIGGLDVRIYHFTNIILHILVSLALFWLIVLLYEDVFVAFLTSAFFAVHPIHTEAVAYISGRADVLAALFVLISFAFYVKNDRKKKTLFYFLSLFSFVLALLSKECAMMFPILLFFYHYAFRKKIRPGPFFSITAIAGVYVFFRSFILRFARIAAEALTGAPERVPGFFAAIANYLKLLILPFNLHMEYTDRLFGFSDPRVISGLAISTIILIYAFRKKNESRFVFFCIAWFFIVLLPVSNIYPIAFYMAEHYLYFPSIGFFLLLARILSLVSRTRRFKIFTMLFIFFLLAAYSYLTIKQNRYWRDPMSFYHRTLKFSSQSARVYVNFGKAYEDAGKTEKAIKMYKRAMEIDPELANSYYNLGVIYSKSGRSEEAMGLFEKAIELDPNYASAYNNLGNLYNDKGDRLKAIRLYKKVVAINPDYAAAYQNLANAYKDTGQFGKALRAYQKAIELDPGFAEAYNNLGILYAALGDKEKATSFFKKAIEKKPDLPNAYYNLGVAYRDMGEEDEARIFFEKAKEVSR